MELDFAGIVKSRYAVKKFDGKTVPQAKVDELLEIIRLTPSSFNLQPWKVKIVTDSAVKEKLKAAAFNQEQVSSCSHLLIFCADTAIMDLVHALGAEMKKGHEKPESLDPYIGMMKGFVEGMPEDKKLTWAQRQVYLALGNALNGAKSLGFDSCPMEGFNPAEVSKILALPANIVPTAFCPIGYAADKPMPKVRFAKDKVFF